MNPIVLALMKVESGGSSSLGLTGDDGRALGPWQLHPDFMAQWYKPTVGDTWMVAMEKAVTTMVTHYSFNYPPADIAQIFHLGFEGWKQGSDTEYAERFAKAYDRAYGKP